MPSDTTDPDTGDRRGGSGESNAEDIDPAEPGPHGDPLVPGSSDTLVGATGDDEPDPDALIEGNRVATAEDME